ncbi:MAG: NAD(P)H-quinone oxidoreductase [Bacteroidota bacterium]
MKAILFEQFGGPEQLYIGKHPKPEPAADEILVRVHATALNRADLLQLAGNYPPPLGESSILGLEMAGIVEACGPEVKRFAPGDRICGLLPGGGYAEYAVLPEALAIPMLDEMGFTEAAAIPEVFLTAFQALSWLADLKAGEKILIHAGASGVGTAAIQLAKEMGASEIFATASSPKHTLCKELGVNHCIDYKSQDYATVVQELTQKRGVDVLVDFVGGPNFAPNLRSMALDGRVVMLAFLGGPHTPEAVNLATILRKRIHIMGSTLRSRTKAYKAGLTQDLVEKHWPDFAAGNLRPIIDSIYPWEQVADAYRRMGQNKNQGKIVLTIP